MHGEMKLLKPSHSWLLGLPLSHAGASQLYLETSMQGGCRILARGGVRHENRGRGGARAKRAKIFVVRIPIFPQIVHVRGPARGGSGGGGGGGGGGVATPLSNP